MLNRGMLLLCSTAQSTRRLQYVQKISAASQVEEVQEYPHWYDFEVIEYPDLAVFNFRDLASSGGSVCSV